LPGGREKGGRRGGPADGKRRGNLLSLEKNNLFQKEKSWNPVARLVPRGGDTTFALSKIENTRGGGVA